VSAQATQGCLIVGYGNQQRRDDGIGPYVVEKLKASLEMKMNVRLLTLSQLSADMSAELQEAERILFVDATIDNLEGGRKWSRLEPEMKVLPYLTHHVGPAFLLGLVESLYGRSLCAWLVSIQGSDFGFGEGLSPEAAGRADRVCLEILEFIGNINGIKRFKVHGSRLKKPTEAKEAITL